VIRRERAGGTPGPFVASGRHAGAAIVLAALALALGLSGPARADERQPTRGESGPVSIGGGLVFDGAVVTGPLPGGPSREIDAYTTAVFVQAWLPGGMFGPPPTRSQPPPDAKRYRVDVTGTWDGADAPPTTWTIFYAAVPGRAWIACPKCRATPTPGAPQPEYWATPARVTDALEGRADLVPVLALETTTTAPAGAVGGSGGSTAGLVVAAFLGIAVVAGFVVRLGRRRHRRSA